MLDAAAKVFKEKGYMATRLADIAAVANIQAGSLYYHFTSREDLVEEVLRVGQDTTSDLVRQRVDTLPADASNVDRIREAMKAHLAAVLEIGDYTSATIRILGQVPDDVRRRRLIAQREYGNYWRQLLEDAREAGEIRKDVDLSAIRMMMMGALNSSTEWYHPHRRRGLSGETIGNQFSTVFLEGLSVRQPVPTPRAEIQDVLSRSHEILEEDNALNGQGQAGPIPTRERVLNTAAELFQHNGYGGTRLVDVAEAAGMQTGSLYYHFSSREDLVAELIRIAWERTDGVVRRSVNALPVGTPGIEKIRMAITVHIMSVLQSSSYAGALVRILGQVPERVRERSVGDQRAYARYWRSLLEKAATNGEIRTDLDLSAIVMMLMGAMNWVVDWFHPHDTLQPEELAAQFSSVIFDGLRAHVTAN
ncbi:MAG TPA: TetR family transcriptional regulator [Amycolatopsis sp.]|nr:TetR family transcriptional regulator [Amycolatopsis sp.]